jgi:AcrR family transcriptional regulator
MLETMKEKTELSVAVEPRSRRERKKERTRQEIYRAAMELFVARGFDDVTVEDICHAADVAKGTFFLHFPTKDALLFEYGEQVSGELEEILHNHRGGAISALRKMLGLLAERALRHADIVRLVVREVMARPAAFVNAREQNRDLVHLLANVVRQGQTSGELRHRVEPRLAAAIITSAYFAIITEWVRCGGQFDLAGAVQQSLDVVLNGLADKKK